MSNCLLCDEEIFNQESLKSLILMKKDNPTMCDNCKNKFDPISEASCKTCCKKAPRHFVKIAKSGNEKERR